MFCTVKTDAWGVVIQQPEVSECQVLMQHKMWNKAHLGTGSADFLQALLQAGYSHLLQSVQPALGSLQGG